ncbi:cytochrome P450 [Coprinopsis cinerea AmutBmut pab1-1]|nr:cytochrome P450 [Coprinopsis cinerea AmutBmut pab1-1]
MTVTSPAALLSLLEDIPRHLASRHGAWLFVVPAVLCAAILGVIRNVQARRRRRNLPLPPGPKGLPILGNLLQIPFEYPWKMYAEWKKQYGDIIYLEALGQKILVLNSLETIEALLVKRAANYSDRSWSPIIDLMRSGWSFSVMNYGAEWRDRRRLFHQFFHDLEDHRPVVQEELLAMLRDLIGRPKEYRDVVRNAMGIIIMRLTYGAVDKDYNKRLIHAADTAVLGFVEYSNPGRMWVNIIPSMRFIPSWFPGAWWKRELLKLAKLTDYLHQQPFADATKRMKEGTQGPHTSFATKLIQALPEEGDPERARQETLARDSVAQAYTGELRPSKPRIEREHTDIYLPSWC